MGTIVGKVFEEPKELTIDELLLLANDKGLDSLTVAQLKVVAKDLDIEFDSKITKKELISLIEENQGEE